MHNVYNKLPLLVNKCCFLPKKYRLLFISKNLLLYVMTSVLTNDMTANYKAIMLSSGNGHNLISLIFCEGYYKAAALTTDKLLQEHQEVHVSKLVSCLFYSLIPGVPNGYQPLISTDLVGNCGRCIGLMVSVVDYGLRGVGSCRGDCAVFLGKALYSHSTSLRH